MNEKIQSIEFRPMTSLCALERNEYVHTHVSIARLLWKRCLSILRSQVFGFIYIGTFQQPYQEKYKNSVCATS